MTNWYAMNTAPKDGTIFMGAIKRDGVWLYDFFRWFENLPHHPPLTGWFHWNGEPYAVDWVPTYWTHMPEAPQYLHPEPGRYYPECIICGEPHSLTIVCPAIAKHQKTGAAE